MALNSTHRSTYDHKMFAEIPVLGWIGSCSCDFYFNCTRHQFRFEFSCIYIWKNSNENCFGTQNAFGWTLDDFNRHFAVANSSLEYINFRETFIVAFWRRIFLTSYKKHALKLESIRHVFEFGCSHKYVNTNERDT